MFRIKNKLSFVAAGLTMNLFPMMEKSDATTITNIIKDILLRLENDRALLELLNCSNKTKSRVIPKSSPGNSHVFNSRHFSTKAFKAKFAVFLGRIGFCLENFSPQIEGTRGTLHSCDENASCEPQ